MKYFLLLILLTGYFSVSQGQEQTAKLLQETAKTLLQKGDFENAVLILERARQQEPGNIELLRDLCYTYYLKRDFTKAIEVGKDLTEKPGADEQSFQVLGLAYKAIASYKECGKLYRTALRKFPKSGVIYNEYAELFALSNELDEAIVQWEKGIEADPGYSGNYYNATMYYIRGANLLRAVLYGEIFLNLESYTARTADIKKAISDGYRMLLLPTAIQNLQAGKNISAFEKSILESFAKTVGAGKQIGSINDLISIRTRFLLEWLQGKQKNYPFHLFDHQQYLVSQGLFEAYNYWLFSTAAGEDALQQWQQSHLKENEGFKTFQQSRVFKLPAGEYYFTH